MRCVAFNACATPRPAGNLSLSARRGTSYAVSGALRQVLLAGLVARRRDNDERAPRVRSRMTASPRRVSALTASCEQSAGSAAGAHPGTNPPSAMSQTMTSTKTRLSRKLAADRASRTGVSRGAVLRRRRERVAER